MNTVSEFWAAVDRSGGPDACWPWLMSCNASLAGYGQLKWRGKVRRAHRLAYELVVGPIPEGLTLDHTCHDPNRCRAGKQCLHRRCCNPGHLEPVTSPENSRRMTRLACRRGHPKTSEHGHFRKDKGTWRCVTCEVTNATRRRRARAAAEYRQRAGESA